jgi:hypothetical protein
MGVMQSSFAAAARGDISRLHFDSRPEPLIFKVIDIYELGSLQTLSVTRVRYRFRSCYTGYWRYQNQQVEENIWLHKQYWEPEHDTC